MLNICIKVLLFAKIIFSIIFLLSLITENGFMSILIMPPRSRLFNLDLIMYTYT